jgi:hypothetical protein
MSIFLHAWLSTHKNVIQNTPESNLSSIILHHTSTKKKYLKMFFFHYVNGGLGNKGRSEDLLERFFFTLK